MGKGMERSAQCRNDFRCCILPRNRTVYQSDAHKYEQCRNVRHTGCDYYDRFGGTVWGAFTYRKMHSEKMGNVEMTKEKNYILEVNNLSKIFDADTEQEKDVLKDVSLKVDRNEFLCMLGPSGCGKTTLLRCIAGFESYKGSVTVNGVERTKPGTDRIMVFQDFNQLFPWKTVEKNIQYPLKLQGIRDKQELKQRTEEVLQKVKLSGQEKYYPYQLSGGMKQRVAIAKALALKPEIILMDEPFAALDAMTRNELQSELLRISMEEKCTFIFITHNIQEAIVLGTRIVVLAEGGRIVVDEKNAIARPVTPASEGYGETWERLHSALYQ